MQILSGGVGTISGYVREMRTLRFPQSGSVYLWPLGQTFPGKREAHSLISPEWLGCLTPAGTSRSLLQLRQVLPARVLAECSVVASTLLDCGGAAGTFHRLALRLEVHSTFVIKTQLVHLWIRDAIRGAKRILSLSVA